jgi:predicted Zn-dependent protease
VAAATALAFPYLSVREVSRAFDEQGTNPSRALSDLQTAATLNPLSADPDRLAGTIALRDGLPNIAAARFARVTARDPGGWYGWLGAGLAASTLGDPAQAKSDLSTAERINSRQPAVREALARVASDRPLSPAQALRLLAVVH